MRTWYLLLAATCMISTAAAAQAPRGPVPEIRPIAGAFVPTGDQRHDFRDAALGGLQLAVELKQNIHLLGTFACSPSKNKPMAVNNRVDLYQYDVGAVFESGPLTGDWLFRPFVGAGVGARTYHLRDVDTKARSYLSGYGAIGTEFQLRRIALRLEGRDYLSRFKGVAGGKESSIRYDLALMAGLAIHMR